MHMSATPLKRYLVLANIPGNNFIYLSMTLLRGAICLAVMHIREINFQTQPRRHHTWQGTQRSLQENFDDSLFSVPASDQRMAMVKGINWQDIDNGWNVSDRRTNPIPLFVDRLEKRRSQLRQIPHNLSSLNWSMPISIYSGLLPAPHSSETVITAAASQWYVAFCWKNSYVLPFSVGYFSISCIILWHAGLVRGQRFSQVSGRILNS